MSASKQVEVHAMQPAKLCWALSACIALGCVPGCLSTETGNPPAMNREFFHWSPEPSGVSVSGAPGAVQPGGSTIEFENLETGETTRTTSRRDGSFEVTLPGPYEDGYEVEAKNEHGRSKAQTWSMGEISDRADAGLDAGPADLADAADAADAEPAEAGAPRQLDAGVDAGSSIDVRDADVPVDASTGRGATSDAAAPTQACEPRMAPGIASVERMIGGLDRTCSVDTDCVFLRSALMTSCADNCSDQVVSLVGREQAAPYLASFEDEVCKPLMAEGCRRQELACKPEERRPGCVNGTCVAVDAMGAVSCDGLRQAADQVIEDVLAAASCSADRDCTTVEINPDCHEYCPLPVTTSAAFMLAPVVSDVDARYCREFIAAGCMPVKDTDCPGSDERPVCTNGRCAFPQP